MRWIQVFIFLDALWSVLVAMIGGLTVLLALLELIGLGSLSDRQIWELALLTIGMVAAYLLFEKLAILLPLRKDMEALGISRVLVGKPQIYGEGATEIFSDIKPHTVRVYASSGLWREDGYKKRWLEAVRKAVEKNEIKVFQGVFGLPPTYDGFLWMKSTLIELFDSDGKKTDNVFLRYLPHLMRGMCHQ